jgi:uncharacterized protein (DUF736 family)
VGPYRRKEINHEYRKIPERTGRPDHRRSGRVGRVKLTFEPNDKGADYRVLADTGFEVGAAWNKNAEKTGKAYISARLDSPFLPKPVNVALFPAKEAGKHVLVWDRQKPKED